MVEDSPAIAELHERTLRQTGWDVARVNLGREAIRLVHEWAPDMVVLDLDLPDVDGRTVLQALKADLRSAQAPVVVVTTAFMDVQREEIRRLGAAAVLEKASTPPALLAEILRLNLISPGGGNAASSSD